MAPPGLKARTITTPEHDHNRTSTLLMMTDGAEDDDDGDDDDDDNGGDDVLDCVYSCFCFTLSVGTNVLSQMQILQMSWTEQFVNTASSHATIS